jgi:hypothetical protein
VFSKKLGPNLCLFVAFYGFRFFTLSISNTFLPQLSHNSQVSSWLISRAVAQLAPPLCQRAVIIKLDERLVGSTNCSGSEYELSFSPILLPEHLLEQGGFPPGRYLTGCQDKICGRKQTYGISEIKVKITFGPSFLENTINKFKRD